MFTVKEFDNLIENTPVTVDGVTFNNEDELKLEYPIEFDGMRYTYEEWEESLEKAKEEDDFIRYLWTI